MYEYESEIKMMTITEEETNKHWTYIPKSFGTKYWHIEI